MGRPPPRIPPLGQVTHYGFHNPRSGNCANSWGSPKGSYAQADQWKSYSQSKQYYADQATDLTYWYDEYLYTYK